MEEVITYNGVSIRLPQGCGFGVARKDGSLTLTVEKPCSITVVESALDADGNSGKRRSKRRSEVDWLDELRVHLGAPKMCALRGWIVFS